MASKSENNADLSWKQDRWESSKMGRMEMELDDMKKEGMNTWSDSSKVKITTFMERYGQADSLKTPGAMTEAFKDNGAHYPESFPYNITKLQVVLRLSQACKRIGIRVGLIEAGTLKENAKHYLMYFIGILISTVVDEMRRQIKDSLNSREKGEMRYILEEKRNSPIYFQNNADGSRNEENAEAVHAIAALTPRAREFLFQCQITFLNLFCCNFCALLSDEIVIQLKRQHDIIAAFKDPRDMVIKKTTKRGEGLSYTLLDGAFWSIYGDEGQLAFVLSLCNAGGQKHVALKTAIATLYRADGTNVATWIAQVFAWYTRFCANYGDLAQLSPMYVMLEICGQLTADEMDKLEMNSQVETLQGIIDGEGGIDAWSSWVRKMHKEGLFNTQGKFIQRNANVQNDVAMKISQEQFATKRNKKSKKKDGASKKQQKQPKRNREGRSDKKPPPTHANSDRDSDGNSKRNKTARSAKKTKTKKKPSNISKATSYKFAYVADGLPASTREEMTEILHSRQKAGRDICNGCGKEGHKSTQCTNVTKGLVLKPVTLNEAGKWVVKKVHFPSENASTATTAWQTVGRSGTWKSEFEVLPDDPLHQ